LTIQSLVTPGSYNPSGQHFGLLTFEVKLSGRDQNSHAKTLDFQLVSNQVQPQQLMVRKRRFQREKGRHNLGFKLIKVLTLELRFIWLILVFHEGKYALML